MRATSIVAVVAVLVLAAGVPASASAQSALDDALRGGHDVFLLVTEPEATGTDGARALAAQATVLAPGALLVEVDRKDPANAPLVAQFRLTSAPVPLILVVARNGVAAGGALPGRTTPAQLAAMVPTPRKAEYLKALSDGQAVFLVVGRPEMAELAAVTRACDEADARLNQAARTNVQVGQTMPKDQAAVISIDLADPAEQRFLAELKADPRAPHPVVVVVNVKGQTTQTFLEPAGVTVEALVAATKKRVSECCPGGKCG